VLDCYEEDGRQRGGSQGMMMMMMKSVPLLQHVNMRERKTARGGFRRGVRLNI
jgi:hypothetical protein